MDWRALCCVRRRLLRDRADARRLGRERDASHWESRFLFRTDTFLRLPAGRTDGLRTGMRLPMMLADFLRDRLDDLSRQGILARRDWL